MVSSTVCANASAEAPVWPANCAASTATPRMAATRRPSFGNDISISSTSGRGSCVEDTSSLVIVPVSSSHAPTIPLHLQSAEQPLRPSLVRLHLRAQCVDVVEPSLVAQPLHERQSHALSVEIAGVSQQIRLHG